MNQDIKTTSYATIHADEGDNYREIAEMMTDIGFPMNHSSARNYVLRIMKKFAAAFIEEWDLEVPLDNVDRISRSPQFQEAICDVLKTIAQDSKEEREEVAR